MVAKQVLDWLQGGGLEWLREHPEHQGDLAWARGREQGQLTRILQGILDARQVPAARVAALLGLDPTALDDVLKGLRDISLQLLAEIGASLGYRLQFSFIPEDVSDDDPDMAMLLKHGRQINQNAHRLQSHVAQHCQRLKRLSQSIHQDNPKLAAQLDQFRQQLLSANEQAIQARL